MLKHVVAGACVAVGRCVRLNMSRIVTRIGVKKRRGTWVMLRRRLSCATNVYRFCKYRVVSDVRIAHVAYSQINKSLPAGFGPTSKEATQRIAVECLSVARFR